MPDQLHQSIIESIELEPELAVELASIARKRKLPAYASLEIANVAVSEVKPVTAFADSVIRLRDAAGNAVFAIILEVQLRRDPDKEWAWPKYWVLVRERERVPTMVLVVAGDDATKRWAKSLLRTGDPHPWHPFVTTLKSLPRITDPAVVATDPVRAVVCALGHTSDRAVVTAIVRGLRDASIREQDREYYVDLILGMAPAALLEAIMQDRKHELLGGFAIKFIAKGREEGIAKGRLDATRQHVRAILAKRRLALSSQEEQQIESCTDLETLNRWFDRAVGANATGDVFVDD